MPTDSDPFALFVWSITILIVGGIFFAAGMFLLEILESHKTAGVIHNVKRRLEELRAGRFTASVTLRRHDHFRELATTFNDTAASLRARTEGELATLRRAQEELDVLVGSGEDAVERDHGELVPPPRFVVTTSGSLGGWVQPGGPFRAVPPPGPVHDAYGCGDCFAAGLTYALAEGRPMEAAVALGARCGAAVLSGRGPYEGQLVAGAAGHDPVG